MGSSVPRVLMLLLLAGGVAAQSPAPAKAEPLVIQVPFAEGESQNVFRGPGVLTHANRFNRYAVDFSPIDEGHLVVASMAGEVVYVKEDTKGPTGNLRDNNEVAIRIPGTKKVVVYLHLQQNGALVEVGDFVLPGDPIGLVGNTGLSEATHLHIDVRGGHRLGPSIPWRFTVWDKEREPRSGDGIRSENAALRPALGPLFALKRQCELAARLGRPELVAERVARLREALEAKRPTKAFRALAERSDGRALLEEVGQQVDRRWTEIGGDLALQLDDESDSEARLVLAKRIADLFPDFPPAEKAIDLVAGFERKERIAVKRTLKQAGKPFDALEKAFAVECRIVESTPPGQIERKGRSLLRSAFTKAAESVPEAARKAVESYRDQLVPPEEPQRKTRKN